MQLTVDVDRICVATVPFCAAKQVLGDFRRRFISEVASEDIVHGLEHKDIITNAVLTAVNNKADATKQAEILYKHLETTSTWESLMTVCDVIIAVKGNPLMRKFGEDLKSKLEG